jgi:hypothetical protein
MPRDLHRRVDRLEGDAPITRTEVWYQDDDGANRWTCDAYPRAYNRSELDVVPIPAGTCRILVARVGPDEWGRE